MDKPITQAAKSYLTQAPKTNYLNIGENEPEIKYLKPNAFEQQLMTLMGKNKEDGAPLTPRKKKKKRGIGL